MKDGRTHLAHKAEHAVDFETGAVVAVTVQDADEGDTTTSIETLIEAAEQIEAVRPDGDGLEEVVGDKGYHSNQSLVDLEALGVRSYISEPDRGRATGSKAGGARGGLSQSSPHSRRTRQTPAAAARRTPGTTLCASLRDRRHAPHASARPREHPETAADPRGRVQSRPPHATPDRRRHAAQSSGPTPAVVASAFDAIRRHHYYPRPVIAAPATLFCRNDTRSRDPPPHLSATSTGFRRGRDAGYPAPPAQIRTSRIPAYGSYLG